MSSAKSKSPSEAKTSCRSTSRLQPIYLPRLLSLLQVSPLLPMRHHRTSTRLRSLRAVVMRSVGGARLHRQSDWLTNWLACGWLRRYGWCVVLLGCPPACSQRRLSPPHRRRFSHPWGSLIPRPPSACAYNVARPSLMRGPMRPRREISVQSLFVGGRYTRSFMYCRCFSCSGAASRISMRTTVFRTSTDPTAHWTPRGSSQVEI